MSSIHPITVSDGRERIVHIYDTRGDHFVSGGSASDSHHSSSASRISSDNSWDDIADDIEPSDSASHPRGNRSSRRHHVEAPQAPSRRESLHRGRDHRDERRRSESVHYRTGHRESLARSSSRRAASGGSNLSVAAPLDDYPYDHPTVTRGGFPPAGYRPPPQPSGGYPPSLTSGGGYHGHDPYYNQALVGYDRADPYAHYRAQPDAFRPQPGGNPFASPLSEGMGAGYFAPEPPPGAPMPPPPAPQRPHHGHSRPQSFVAPGYGSDMMAPGYGQMMPYNPVAFGIPGYPPMPSYGWPPHPPAAPATTVGTAATPPPPPKQEINPELEKIKEMLAAKMEAETKKDGAQNEEITVLKKMLETVRAEAERQKKEFEADRAKREAAKLAAELKAAEEKKKKEEIAEASRKAKDEAETKAAAEAKKLKDEAEAAAKKIKDETEAAAKKAKDEADKKLAEATKAKEESEAKKKELEETLKKNAPEPDALKAPIRFKDAVGRKFSFPWAHCKTWKGMEGLIKQAFLHVDKIGEHVHQGHYDLTGPDGEIILPQVWDTMVKPDWEITMHLWPIPEDPKGKKAAKQPDPMMDAWGPMDGGLFGMPPAFGPGGPAGPPGGGGGKLPPDLEAMFANLGHGGKKPAAPGKSKSKSGKTEKKKPGSPVIDVPMGPPGGMMGGMPMMGGGIMGGPPGLYDDMMYGDFVVPGAEKKKEKSSSSKSKSKKPSGFATFMLGGAPAKKKK